MFQDPLVAVSGRAIEAQGGFALSYILMLILREREVVQQTRRAFLEDMFTGEMEGW